MLADVRRSISDLFRAVNKTIYSLDSNYRTRRFETNPTSSRIPLMSGLTHMPKLTRIPIFCIGGSRGRAGRTPPYGTQFFCFHIHFCRKVPMSEVHAPPNGSTPPLREILDPPLFWADLQIFFLWFIH